MAKIKLKSGQRDKGPVRIYGFVEEVTKPLSNSHYARFSIVMDAVDADVFDESDVAPESAGPLSIVRIQTTPRRLESLFGVAGISEGMWFEATLNWEPGKPVAWMLRARNNYATPVRKANLSSLRLMRMDASIRSEFSGYRDSEVLSRLTKWCQRGAKGAARPSTRLAPQGELHVRAVDVGQASCNAIHAGPDSNAKILGYYDVGAPLFFHYRTFPARFPDRRRVPDRGFVALSHWDFDHYSLALTKMPALRGLTWFAPKQPVGPNAARLQTLLGPNLKYIETPVFMPYGGVQLIQGGGMAPDRNSTGYAMRIEIPSRGGAVLLTGDVGYQWLSNRVKANLIALGVAHHGGHGSSAPPIAHVPGSTAIVSYGKPNRYGHPNDVVLRAHRAAGWSVLHTAAQSPGRARGDRWY